MFTLDLHPSIPNTNRMGFEIETKVLAVPVAELIHRLEELNALKILDTRLTVDWYRPADEKTGDEKWYLRIRSRADGSAEMTWKGKSDILGSSRKHKEINIPLDDFMLMGDFLESIGMVTYAHQEKDRISYELNEWRIDIDTYPDMPSYAEIEGHSEEHIQEALSLLHLEGHTCLAEGERTLIEREYGLDWFDMRFK